MQPNKDKQEVSLDSLKNKLTALLNVNPPRNPEDEPDATKANQISQLIKKLQPTLHSILNCSPSPHPQQHKLTQIVHTLASEATNAESPLFLQWLVSIAHISTSTQQPRESIYTLPQVSDQAVIALPCDSQPVTYPVISVVSDSAAQQAKSTAGDNKQYYKEDDQMVEKYLEQPFSVVRREGATEYATRMVQALCGELIDGFLQATRKEYSLELVSRFLELVQAVSAPVYTSYLLSIFDKSVKLLTSCSIRLTHSVTLQKINRLVYTLNSIASRWEATIYDDKTWQWQIKSKLILLLIKSSISQSKLTGVKLLCEVARRVEYTPMEPAELVAYIRDHGVLEAVFSLDSHPEVVAKGRDIYEFLCKYEIIQDKQVEILLNLIDKSHENVCKSVYLIIQSFGQRNLEHYYRKIMTKVQTLPRASFFTDETLQLLQTLLVIAPLADIKANMRSIYQVVSKHYAKLRKHLREKLLRIYFEIFLMGVEEGVFGEDDRLIVVEQVGGDLGSNLSALTLDTFVREMRKKAGSRIEKQAKLLLNQSIECLFKKYKFHQMLGKTRETQTTSSIEVNKSNCKDVLASNPQYYSPQIHLHMCKYLLDCYDGPELLLTYEQLCQLIEQDISMCKFIQYYQQAQQLKAIESLLQQTHKDSEHLSTILQVYSLMNSNIKAEGLERIRSWFLGRASKQERVRFGEFIVGNCAEYGDIGLVCQSVLKQARDQSGLFSLLVILRNLIQRHDKKGFDKYLPFKYLSNSTDIVVRVEKLVDPINPTSYTLRARSYQTLSQIVSQIMERDGMKLSGVNMKVNQKYISIGDLSANLGQLASRTTRDGNQENRIEIAYYEVSESEWFDKSQLINNRILNDNIIIALSEIFTQYTSGGRMHRPEIAKLFAIATGVESISVNDSRIEHLFTYSSINGEYLTLEEWLNFYQNAAEGNPSVVISNLKKLGYAHLFRDQSEILQQYEGYAANAARQYIISSGVQVYNILLAEHSDQKLHTYCKQLLLLLPVHPQYITYTGHQDATDEHSLTQQIKREQLRGGLSQLKGKNSLYQWYLLSLLRQSGFRLEHEIIVNLEQVLRNRIDTAVANGTKLDEIDTQILCMMAASVKQHLQQLSPALLPATLITAQKAQQLALDYDHEIEDALPADYAAPHAPFLSYPQVLHLTSTLLRTQHLLKLNQLHLIDGLLLMLLHTGAAAPALPDTALVFHPVYEIRTMFNNYYYLLCEIETGIRQAYYGVRVEEIGESGDGHQFAQFFNNFNKMLQLENNENQGKIYETVSNKIGNSIKDSTTLRHPQPQVTDLLFNKSRQQHNRDEDILLGRLLILDSMKVLQPELQISHPETWLRRLLLEPHNNSTKAILYRIAKRLCSVQFNFSILKQMMQGISVRKNSKCRESGPMGMFNLGCICYINSTVQQLFMVEPFRRGILATRLSSTDPQSYFYQFQSMLYHLAYGRREFHIPDQFCLSFKDEQGKPINIAQQHDADEFLNNLFDRLQHTLKSKEVDQGAELIKENFCGQLASLITCQTCFNQKIRIEDYYVLTLQIKNNKNLQECFQKLTEPEVITDYYCQNCDKKVDTIQKQVKINKLPQFLFLHLQRLVFDLESLSKIKLEHLIDYPQQLDLEQFYLSQSPQQTDNINTRYSLKGFIVHIGNSESGHYYSLVRQGGRWVKFDDSRVEEWIEDGSSRDKENTYILIYERVESKQESGTGQLVQYSIGNPQLYQQVSQDNACLIKQTIFLQKSFSQYLLSTLSSIEIPPQMLASSPNQIDVPFNPDHHALSEKQCFELSQAHSIILDYIQLTSQAKSLGNNFHDYNQQHFKTVACFLIMIYHIHPQLVHEGVRRLLPIQDGKVSTNVLREILVLGDRTIRQAYKLIFTKIMQILGAFVQPLGLGYHMPAVVGSDLHYLQKVLEYLVGSLYDAAKNYGKMEEHFEFMLLIVQYSRKACQWFAQQGLGPKLIHFICGDETAMKGELPSYNYTHPKKTDAMASIVEVLCQMIHTDISNNSIQLGSLCQRAYLQTRWYTRLFQQRYQCQSLAGTLARLCHEHEQLTCRLMKLVLEKLNRFSHNDKYICTYVDLLQHLLGVSDSLNQQRLQTLLGIPWIQLHEDQLQDLASTRYYSYRSNQISDSDEVMLPMLQLMYINRLQNNTLTHNLCVSLLRAMLNSKEAMRYVNSIPAPEQYEFYTGWVVVLLGNGLKKQHPGDREVLNQIAELLNGVEAAQPPTNQTNKNYRLKGKLTKELILEQAVENQHKLQLHILTDQAGTRLLSYSFTLPQTMCRTRLQLHHYPYTMSLTRRSLQVTIPHPGCDFDPADSFCFLDCTFQEPPQPPLEEPLMQQVPVISGGYGNNAQTDHPVIHQGFECPFCTAVSQSFASRCPTCGEEWGEMM